MAVILLLGVMFSWLILFISTIAYLYDFDLSGHESEFQDLLELFVDLGSIIIVCEGLFLNAKLVFQICLCT
jgi:hypothetical protein